MTVKCDHGGVERRKTTVYLDPDVLTATKVLAATRQQSESQLVEDALRAYFDSGQLEAARADLRALMERVAAQTDLDGDEAMALAVKEVRAVRSSRRSRHTV
ncbi:MAG: CopG family transcriptional regulator [Acidimicrobiales bacterium]